MFENDDLTLQEQMFENENYKFENIPESERLHPDKTLCGLLKVYSLLIDPTSGVFRGADHDIIGLPHEREIIPLTKEDVIYLKRCGVHYNLGLVCYPH